MTDYNKASDSRRTDGTSNDRLMTGMFRDRKDLENAYSSLSERGYTKDDINLIMSDETRKKHFENDYDRTEVGTKAMEGAGTGSAIGGTIGAVAGVIAALGTSLVIPGLGMVVAGPIAAGLAGAGAGGITGGVIGALVGSGIPEDRAKEYEKGVKSGGMVLGVKPRNDDDAAYIEKTWSTHRGENIYR